MRAAWYERTGPAHEVLVVGDLPTPAPGPGQVLVWVAASGVNPHDTKKRSGWTGGAMQAARVIPHGDGAGTVVAVGRGVDAARVGERVWLYRTDAGFPGGGTAAEYCTVPAAFANVLPNGVEFA
ncbi:MAG: alcohol dehydrogenase catalytic domain-containing protein, partial [Chloroflexia bacterium]|nr:alcohol dehydrogenase catalytic domain-containing protein [Chloroflexia bacterium]